LAQDQKEQTTAPRWGGKVLVVGVIVLLIALIWIASTDDPTGLLVGAAQGMATLVGIALAIVGLGGLILKK
jgi:hypothetical protein